MTEERRYDEEEVAAIFAHATEARAPTGTHVASRGDGLTLPELEEIAQEVGIAPELVRRAAHSLDAGSGPALRRWMGVPFGVGRTVELSRPLTDREWQRLVAKLRDTFDASGSVEVSGELRQWRNGNLRVAVEPTGSGYRLRMKTKKGDLAPLVAMGASMLAMALVLFVVAMVSGTAEASSFAFLGLMGLGTIGASVARMPFWARTRSRQMDEIAEEVAELAALPPAEPRAGGEALRG